MSTGSKQYIDRGWWGVLNNPIELTYLLMLALVPLVFSTGRSFGLANFAEPKAYLIHFGAFVMLVTWLWTRWWSRRAPTPPSRLWATHSWVVALLILLGVWAAWAIMSAAQSVNPALSIMGRDPNNTGPELSTLLSVVTITIITALSLRSAVQVIRALWVIAAVSALTAVYGIIQSFGTEPITTFPLRLPPVSSLGNAIYFGAYMVAGIGAAASLFVWNVMAQRVLFAMLATSLMAVSVVGLVAADVTGPTYAVFLMLPVGVIGFSVAYYKRLRLWHWGRTLVLTITLVATCALAWQVAKVLPEPAGEQASTTAPADLGGLGGEAFAGAGTATVPPTTFAARRGVWEGVVNGVLRRDITDLTLWAGIGPGLSYYESPKFVPPQYEPVIYADVHNLPIQILFETGVGGALLAGAALLLGAVLLALLIRKGRLRWRLLIALLGMMVAGMLVEQLSGLVRPATLLTLGVLAGLLIGVMRIQETELSRDPPGLFKAQRSSPSEVLAYTAMAFMFATTVLLSDVLLITASRHAAAARTALSSGERDAYERGLASLSSATDAAPWVEGYALALHDIALRAADRAGSPAMRQTYLATAREAVLRFEEWDARSYTVNIVALRDIASGLTEQQLGGLEFKRRLLYLKDTMREYPMVQAYVAHGLVIAGEPASAREAATAAIRNEVVWPGNAQAYWALGEADRALGLFGEARGAYLMCLEKLKAYPETNTAVLARAGLAELDALEAKQAEEIP